MERQQTKSRRRRVFAAVIAALWVPVVVLSLPVAVIAAVLAAVRALLAALFRAPGEVAAALRAALREICSALLTALWTLCALARTLFGALWTLCALALCGAWRLFAAVWRRVASRLRAGAFRMSLRLVPWLRGLIPALAAFALVSCCPCRHMTASQRDSVRVVTAVSTVERLVRDTIWIGIPDQSERVVVRDTVSRLENDYAVSRARVYPDGSLEHELRTKPQRRPVEALRRETETVRTDTVCIDRVRRDVVEVARPLTWWQQTQVRGFWILSALALLLAARWWRRR